MDKPDEELALGTNIVDYWLNNPEDIPALNSAIETTFDKARLVGKATLLITIFKSEDE